MGQKEPPIFFDQTGNRWRKAKWILAVFLVSATGLLAVLVPALAAPVNSPVPAGAGSAAIGTLEEKFNAQNTPVLGRGQFIRAVELKKRGVDVNTSDVFSGQPIRALTKEERVIAADRKFALLRYGQLPDRKLALTFDDGPDPVYTPRLLDVLSEHQAPATFFVIGANVVKHPEVVKRIVREGHVVGNHTFSHLNFDLAGSLQGEQEINQTSRVITAATGQRTAYLRVPYAGSTDQSLRDSIKGVLHAQRLGYVPVAYDYDTRDWTFKADQKPDPSIFDGSGKILLVHDSGGDRSHTISYIKQLLPMAEASGYELANLEQVAPTVGLLEPSRPSNTDKAAFMAGQTFLVWPAKLMLQLFAVNVGLILLVTGLNITLAFLQKRRSRRQVSVPRKFRPDVSVIVPAYNEAAVLESSVRSVLASGYKNLNVTIVDDGSSDDTWKVARRLAFKNRRVNALHQRNQGKAAALNKGIRESSGEIVICIDADTLFTRGTVWRLVRHFYDPKVGAVAGYVRVGNARNWLSRWQALEYIVNIAIERSAQAFWDAITVVPGACGAWRRQALQKSKGFSDRTLAEDCDLALSVHEAGYSITQEMAAMSYTECPLTLGDLAKQRFRWTFGNIQSFWKHRNMFFAKKYRWLGMFVLPNAAMTILLPLLFWPLLLGMAVANILAGRWWIILLFLAALMTLQLLVAVIGLVLAKESPRHLLAVPLTRLVYGPLRTYILYRSLLTVLRGALVGWNKLSRTKTVTAPGHAPTFRAIRQPAEE